MKDRPAQGSRQLDHTADLAIEFWAPTEEALLVEGARALTRILTEDAEVEADSSGHLALAPLDREDRLVQWLNEIIHAAVTDGFVFASAELELGDRSLTAEIHGTTARDKVVTELKSVTYHDLCLLEHAHGWYARVVVDV